MTLLLVLRNVVSDDLPVFFQQQLDPDANYMATQALTEFLAKVQPIRPLRARVAKDNLASLRVLEKCGFTIVGEDKGFAYARNAETEEYLLHLV